MSKRVLILGSSSAFTPENYITQSYHLGELIAERNHILVTGGGAKGCMGACSKGVRSKHGRIHAVIHRKFIVDKHQDPDIVEFVVADGHNLSERKRLLFEGVDCVVCMPGGAGTYDELWELACERNVGFSDVPICLVNIDGFYDGSIFQLSRAASEKLLYKTPDELIHVENNVDDAMAWCEVQMSQGRRIVEPVLRNCKNNDSDVTTSSSQCHEYASHLITAAVIGVLVGSLLGLRK